MKPRDRRPAPSNVTSIVGELERRQLEHARKKYEGSRRREVHKLLEQFETRHSVEHTDFDELLAQLEGESGPEVEEAVIDLRLARGLQRCVRGEEAEGLAEWEAVMAEYPRVALPWVVRARWRMESQKDAAGALSDLDHAAKLEPRDARVYWLRGQVHQIKEDWTRAIANYRTATALDPEDVDGLRVLADALMETGEAREAVGVWNRVVALAPEYADFHAGRAMALMVAERLEEAVAAYDRSLQLEPTVYPWRACRALVLTRLGRYEEALAETKTLAEMAPERASYHAEMGDLYVRLKKPELALAPLTRALEMEPEAWAYQVRADAYEALGRIEEAVADLERAMELDPTDRMPAAQILKHRLPRAKAEGLRGRLGAEIERLLSRFPDDAEFLEMLAEILVARGKKRRALAAYDRLIAVKPDVDGEVYLRRAIAHARLRQVRKAFDDAKRAVERSPKNAKAWAALAVYRTHVEGDDERALVELNRAVKLAPGDTTARYQRAVLLMNRGAYERAIKDVDRVIEQAPNLAQVYLARAECRRELGDKLGARRDRAMAKRLAKRGPRQS
jgi:tetratricopeptide (TPR) repeat protein